MSRKRLQGELQGVLHEGELITVALHVKMDRILPD